MLVGMKWIPKLAGLAIGIVIAMYMVTYWDNRHADMVCDIAQDPKSACQEPFIELDRLKHNQQSTDRQLAR